MDKEHCTYESYADINQAVINFIKNDEYEDYDLVFITDISVNLEVARLIDVHMSSKCILLDHHDTVLALNGYSWADVIVNHDETHKACGASLVKEWLSIHGLYNGNSNNFVEKVRRYDTWEWFDVYNDLESKNLSDLFRIYGKKKFYDKYRGMLRCVDNDLFSETDKTLLELEQQKINNYIYKKNKQMKICPNYYGYKVGVVFAEDYISELGNKLCIDNPEIDFCVIITFPYTLSFRGIKNIHLGNFAKEYLGGGGHPNSAGAQIYPSQLSNVLGDLGISL